MKLVTLESELRDHYNTSLEELGNCIWSYDKPKLPNELFNSIKLCIAELNFIQRKHTRCVKLLKLSKTVEITEKEIDIHCGKFYISDAILRHEVQTILSTCETEQNLKDLVKTILRMDPIGD